MYTRYALTPKRFAKLFTWQLGWVLLYSLAVLYLFDFIRLKELAIPLAIPGVLGTAISILLGFKTSAAYDRWWEARKVWGAIINDSRSFVRQVLSFVSDQASQKQMAHRQIAWVYTLGSELRRIAPPTSLQRYLTQEELVDLQNHNNKSNALLNSHSSQLRRLYESGAINPYHFGKIDETIKALCDHMGKSERIKNTVFPLQYKYVTKWALNIFIVMLPLALVESLDLFMVPVVLLMQFFFGLIDMIASFLKDPFENRGSDTPVSAIARTIEINILQTLQEEHIPDSLTPNDEGVIM